MAGNGAAAAGLPTLEEVAHDPNLCRNKRTVGASRVVVLSINAEGSPRRGIGAVSVVEHTTGGRVCGG